MKNILDKIERFEKQILNEPGFILAPNSYIFDMTEIEAEGEFTEYFRAICYRNTELLFRKKEELDALRKTIEELKPIVADTPVAEVTPTEDTEANRETKRDISNYIAVLENGLFDDESKTLLESLTHEDRIRVKLYFWKKVILLRKQIRQMMMIDPTQDIKSLQDLLVQYELTVEYLKDLTKETEKDDVESSELSRIIFVPDLKNKSSYILGDIVNYLDNRKEIKNVIDKIVEGYFLKTKDTKAIEKYKEHKLYEYKLPNGIRVLYVVNGGYVYICSLFYKDKQRSIRIDSNYEDAVNRFYSSIDYIRENINNPDFYIEQDEYLAGINEVLDVGMSITKRIGE